MLGKVGRHECEKQLFWDSGGLDADLESSQGMGVSVGGCCGVMGEGVTLSLSSHQAVITQTSE